MEKEVFKIYKIAYTNKYRTNTRTYEVSNLGRVKCNGIIIQPRIHNSYYKISNIVIHRAVAELFIPNPENKPCVDHINTNPLDNRAENLRWVTQKENNNNPLTKKHYSEAKRGKALTAEHKRKISASHMGITHTEKTKQKISNSVRSTYSVSKVHKGKTFSEESRAKLSASKKGRHWKLVDGKRIWYD